MPGLEEHKDINSKVECHLHHVHHGHHVRHGHHVHLQQEVYKLLQGSPLLSYNILGHFPPTVPLFMVIQTPQERKKALLNLR